MSAHKAKGQPNTVPRQWFSTGEHSLPIAETEEPLPCPFCGTNDCISIEIEVDDDNTRRAHAECETCGCRCCCAIASKHDERDKTTLELVQEAVKEWNTRQR